MLAYGKEYKQVTIFERLIQLGKHVIIVLLSQNRNVRWSMVMVFI